MANLHDDSFRGTLTLARLHEYLYGNDPTSIDSVGGAKEVTPLAGACGRGHLEIVRLLLDNPYSLADPNALSPNNRTPLFYATTHSSKINRAAIVRALLTTGANVDECYENDGGNTPLMNAIAVVRDKEVVRELLNRGASVTRRNVLGQTAQDLAKGTELESELEICPKHQQALQICRGERGVDLGKIINAIVAIFTLIIAYFNSCSAHQVAAGVATKILEVTCEGNTTCAKPGPENPHSVGELKSDVDVFVRDTGLERFFAPQDPFVHNIVEKASELKDDPVYADPENIQRLTRLSLYQPIVYCDDSSSMITGNRWGKQGDLVSRIAHLATRLLPDSYGVELRFINNDMGRFLHDAEEAVEAMTLARPNGGSKIGTGLREKILRPLVYDVLAQSGGHLPRPLLVCVITDGSPNNERVTYVRDVIVECRQTLVDGGYDHTSVMFCVCQIGNDASATRFLDDLRSQEDIQDVLYIAADKWDELEQNDNHLEEWLLRLLTGPITDRDNA